MMKRAKIDARNWAWVLCLAVLPLERANAQFVEVKAEIELTSSWPGKTRGDAKPKTISVTCITGTNCWWIENDWSLNALNRWYFDGTNVYRSSRITKPLPPNMQQDMKAGGFPMPDLETTRSNQTVDLWPSPDGQPLGDVGVNLPWLAFCSGTFLKREGRLIALPCEDDRHTPDRYAYTDQTEVFDDTFGLPRSIDLFFSRSLYVASVEGFYQGWGTRYLEPMKHAAAKGEEGALTFHYAVTATTNLLGRNFPLQFEFFQNGREFLQNEGWFKRGAGTLKSVRETEAPKGLFDPAMQQTILDWRFHDQAIDGNIYRWEKASVPDVQDPLVQESFEQRVEEARRHNQNPK